MRMLLLVAAIVAAILAAPPAVADTSNEFRLRTESIHEVHDNRLVTATAYDDGFFHVEIQGTDGQLLFESSYPVRRDDGYYIDWTYHGVPSISRSNLIGPEVSPTLRTMTFAAKDIVRMIDRGLAPGSQSRTPRTEDSFGCDMPGFLNVECTNRGNCCDVHDECYWAYECSWWSWLGVSNILCEGCNARAVVCVTTGLGSTGQPSACCAQGNCGAPRCNGLYWDDPRCTLGPPPRSGPRDRDPAPNPGNTGGGGGGGIPGGTVSFPGATCCFPGGQCLPCGV